MKKWKIYFLILSLLSGSLLSSLFISKQEAYANNVIKLSASQEASLISNLKYELGLPSNADAKVVYIRHQGRDKNYALAYSCSRGYQSGTLKNCGLALLKDGSGSARLGIRAGFVLYDIAPAETLPYSRQTSSQYLDFDSSNYIQSLDRYIFTSTEETFNKEIFFDPLPQFIKSEFTYKNSTSTEEKNNNPFDLSGIVDGIVNGIKSIFNNFTKFISSSYESITQAIGDFTSPMRKSLSEVEKYFGDDPLGKLGTSITDFFTGLPDMLSNFVKSLFTVEPDYVSKKIDSFRSRMEQKLGTIGSVFSDMVYFMQVFTRKNGAVRCNVTAVPIVDDSLPVGFNLCKVPKPYLLLARVLLYIALISLLFHRFVHFISVLVGSRYVWSLEGREKEKETD